MSASSRSGLLVVLVVATLGCSPGAATRQTAAAVSPPGPRERAVAESDAQPPEGLPWRRDERPLIDAGSLDVPTPDGRGEISLLAFSFDPRPVEAWRYDACVAAGACHERAVSQPGGDSAAPAVGMRWEDANGYCVTRGLLAQSPAHAYAIRSSLDTAGMPPEVLRDADSEELVTAGFRCVRVSE